MPRILKRPLARTDLEEIWDFIADHSQERADSFVDRLDESIQTLALNPNLGRQRNELAEGLRSFPVGRYLIYFPLPDGIDIVRVLHGSRDLSPLFGSESE
jgi:toxin ParE1/3/4